MARPVRIDVTDGWYHVTARGIERRPIFLGDRYCRHFCELVGEMGERYAVGVHAYVLMGNHYHLLIQTPQANASRALQWLNVSFSAWFNRKQQRAGHVFQGRFKSVLIDGDGSWLLEASVYLHLNPVRVQALGLGKQGNRTEAYGLTPPDKETIRKRLTTLRDTPWNSYRDYAGYTNPPDWLIRRNILARTGGKRAYRRYVESRVTRGAASAPFDDLKTRLLLGSREFEQRMKKLAGRLTEEQPDRKQVLQTATFDEIVRAVEQAKGEKWESFRDRYGDWGRDLVLYLARKRSGLTLREIGEKAEGVAYKTVSRAIVCFGQRLETDRKLADLTRTIMEYGDVTPIATDDARNIATGHEIPSEGYCDQPYVVKTQDGAWLCVMTTGRGPEGQHGQHVVATRSSDHGRTWSSPVDIEPADGPEASWAMPLATPAGRIYVFYTYNAENRREVIADDPPFADGICTRVDSLGQYAFKYSDDGGINWSRDRHFIPVREMAIDRNNAYAGQVKFFWGVGKPIVLNGTMFFGFSKVGGFGEGFFTSTESCFMRSDNILTEPNPEKIAWETLPEGDHGLRSPEGPIAEEVNLTALSDSSLYCTYRTVAGHPGHAYSRDGGRTWTEPEFMTHFPGGPVVSNPRGPNFVRRLESGPYAGRYIYWFYNHNARGYDTGSRNTAWLLGGVEHDSPAGKVIHWGRPEVVLYTAEWRAAVGYPDFVEEGDRLFITETQKVTARVHEVPNAFLRRLWEPFGD